MAIVALHVKYKGYFCVHIKLESCSMLTNCYTSRKDYYKKFASTVHRSLFATCLSAGMYGEVHLSYSYA